MLDYSNVKYCFNQLKPHFIDEMGRVHWGRDCGPISFSAYCSLEYRYSDRLIVHFYFYDVRNSDKDLAMAEFGIYQKGNRWSLKTIADKDDSDTKVKFLTSRRLELDQFNGIHEVVFRIEMVKLQLKKFFLNVNESNIKECLDEWSKPGIKWVSAGGK